MASEVAGAVTRLQRPIDSSRDHIRGGKATGSLVSVVVYGDYLCPYCRRLRHVLARLRQALGERLVYAFRHFPNERAHPGATWMALAAEAAGKQGRFWEMHDALYEREPPLTREVVHQIAGTLGLDMERFERDLAASDSADRIADDLAEGRRNGVSGTPTIFVDGLRYDGAWDFYSMLESLERPVAERLQRQARVFANLPASGGLVLLLAAAIALLAANSPYEALYRSLIDYDFNIGPAGGMLSLTIGAWFSEGLLAVFFLLVGLEIRREITAGALSEPRAAILPVIGAIGGVLAPTAIYLLFNRGVTASGWAVPTATDIAFTIGILALLGERVPASLRVFVAALAVVDDILSVLTLAIFYPHTFHPSWLILGAGLILLLYALNRARVYASWPYGVVTIALWIAMHGAGVHAALAGVFLAAFLPTRPAPQAGPLLAQAATALATLEQAEDEAKEAGTRVDQEPVWDWASRQLSAASERLLSPADRIERAVAPWSAYVILPLFAFSATGVAFDVDLGTVQAREMLLGIVLGLVIGKPVGISIACLLAIKSRIAVVPGDIEIRKFIGAACLCGIGYTVALLMADQAFPPGDAASTAKIGVLLGSVVAAMIGTTIVLLSKKQPPITVDVKPAT